MEQKEQQNDIEKENRGIDGSNKNWNEFFQRNLI